MPYADNIILTIADKPKMRIFEIYKGYSRKAVARGTVLSNETEGDNIEDLKVQAGPLTMLDVLWRGRRRRMAFVQQK